MIIYQDTREKPGKHNNVVEYLTSHDIKVVRQALNVGDYQIAGRGNISIDLKQDCLELIQDVTHDHERFRNELIRAQEAGISLVVLIEEKLPYGRLDLWESPRKKNKQPYTKMDGRTLRKILITMQEKYGVRFRFCGKDEAGERVLHYLEGGE